MLIGLLDNLLQSEKESLENMSLDLNSEEPLDLTDGGTNNQIRGSIVQPSSASATAPSSIFMSPRRRAGTDDGPAINETRMLNLPDRIAETRDNMKTLIGRQRSRLKSLKLIVSFHESLACTIETFAYGIKSQIENNPSNLKLNKNEGSNVLCAWNAAIGSLEMYAKNSTLLSKEIRKGNYELQQLLTVAEKETRALQEKEEYRWKSLCDASKVETKAKMKQKQYVADLEKAKAKCQTLVEGEGGSGEEGGGTGDNGDTPNNVSPKRTTAETKIDRHMNKAMGKMFSILPGGGEDVMNKVLTPQQRQAIATRQLDEAQEKEEKGTESFEVARSVKQQALVSYETEAEACEFKFKSDSSAEWSMMHKSLISSVDAMRNFRERQLNSVMSSIGTIKEHSLLQEKALDDVTRWTTFTEKRLKDQRDRIINDSKDDERQYYSLKVELVECANVEETIRHFLDDEYVMDDSIDFGGENIGLESPMKDAHGHDGISNDKAVPLPDVPADTFIQQMDLIFSKKLKNVSIEEYYTAGWSEETPLYGPWLKKKGSFDVSVSDWEHSPDGGFVNEWSKEKFTHKRVSPLLLLNDDLCVLPYVFLMFPTQF